MTLLIRNVKIVGGEKEYPSPADLFVNNGIISAIGTFPNKNADVTLDGQGSWLSPGFIDVDTDSDHYLTLFDHRSQEDFLRQGVTTILGGMCGSSLAPLAYGTLESFRKWGDPSRVNVNWHTLAEFLQVLESRPLAVNFGTLVGHSTVRRALVGEALRELTKNELGVFQRTLEEALEEGAFGLSAGLEYVHSRNTPYSELSVLAKVVAHAKGVFAMHLRDGGSGIEEATMEAIRLAKESGVRMLISHFVPRKGAEAPYEKALKEIEELPNAVDLHFDIYPFQDRLLPIYTFLPAWAQNGGVDVMLANVKDEWLKGKIRKDIAELDERHFIIAQAPGNDFLVGKSLLDVKRMYELHDGRDALLKLMATMEMKGSILYRGLDEGLIKKAIAASHSMIGSNAPSFAKDRKLKRIKTELTTSTFTKFLWMAAHENLMPIEDAVRKITAQPAAMFGLKGRGVIKEGNIADLACFKINPENAEVRFTIVNGTLTEMDGSFKDVFPGKALRHKKS